ncbi:MAG: PKD domain-containing protein, partial [Proteobacteria bacterium]|nr:PKD domain-containing protein [Pseudomonadota bacterium]
DEWDLDSQDIVGMAGGQVGKIIWYQTPSLSDADMNANFNTIVSANAAKIINVSIGGCETSAKGATANASDQSFAQGVAQGQTFSISTGDSGADECGNGGTTPSWPANSQYVVAVAGTTLNATTGANATWSSETVWKDSGGSQSKYEPKPSWQTLWSGSYRGVADVAFDGDPNSGAKVIVKGVSSQIGGTSLSAPLFAGEWTRVIATKGTGVGFAGPIIYKLPASAFHDITSGSNGISAGPGYDLASGRGSMILSAALANWPGGGGGGGGGNTPPTANFTYKISGLKVNFTDQSTDSDGTIVSYSWTFGDGKTSTTKSPQHTYKKAGTYSVTETVTDNNGATGSKTQSVTVK